MKGDVRGFEYMCKRYEKMMDHCACTVGILSYCIRPISLHGLVSRAVLYIYME